MALHLNDARHSDENNFLLLSVMCIKRQQAETSKQIELCVSVRQGCFSY